MARNITLEKGQQIVDAQPKNGQCFPYAKFPFYCNGGKEWLLTQDYLVEGKSGDDLRDTLAKGMTLEVWAGPMRAAHRHVFIGDDLKAIHTALKAEARSQCQHTWDNELSGAECDKAGVQHFGSCYHVYKCGKCHTIFSVDSSD